MKSLVSVIIPCYNDGPYLPPIIEQLRQSKYIGEIIVVDDGSKVATKNILKQLKGIILITNTQNIGKSLTLKAGVLASKHDIVVFIDSDLVGLTVNHFDDLVKPVINKSCDITISVRENEVWYGKLSGYAIAFTGERAIPRDLLICNIDLFDLKGYLIEAEFNRRFLGKRKVKGVLWQNVGQHPQYKKYGKRGWINYYRQFFNYLWHLGPLEMVRQFVFVKKPGFVLQS